jgi:hypothetical protein
MTILLRSSSSVRRARAFFVIFALALIPAFAKTKAPVQHAPLPIRVLTAKKLFIENESGEAATADVTYSLLKEWGKYQIVTDRQEAELILTLNTAVEQENGSETGNASSYNYKTGGWTSGTVTVPSTDTWRYTQMKLVDPLTGAIAWEDRRIWWRKHHPIEELINSLRERVEEQQPLTLKSK